MKIPLISNWFKKREIKVYIANFVTLEMRKARIQAMREYAEDVRKSLEQNHRD
jgi:hypothetical protein